MSNVSRGLALEVVETSADSAEVQWSDAASVIPSENDIDRTAQQWAEYDVLSDIADDRAQNVQLRRRHLAG
jgi:hypothetical protein